MNKKNTPKSGLSKYAAKVKARQTGEGKSPQSLSETRKPCVARYPFSKYGQSIVFEHRDKHGKAHFRTTTEREPKPLVLSQTKVHDFLPRHPNQVSTLPDFFSDGEKGLPPSLPRSKQWW